MISYKRGFLEIIAEILDALLQNSLRKTHIAFKCKLDSRAVTKYLKYLEKIDLVEKSKDDPQKIIITEKGVSYRNKYLELMRVINIDYTDSLSTETLKEKLATVL